MNAMSNIDGSDALSGAVSQTPPTAKWSPAHEPVRLATPSAATRLQRSREHLRVAMVSRAAPRADARNAHTNHDAAVQADGWWDNLHTPAGANILIEGVRNWWAHHPLQLAGVLATNAATTLVRPLAQRHPVQLVAGALLTGAVLMWSRPWRLLTPAMLKPAMLAGLLPQLLVTAVRHAPIRSWGGLFDALRQSPGKPAARTQGPSLRAPTAQPARERPAPPTSRMPTSRMPASTPPRRATSANET